MSTALYVALEKRDAIDSEMDGKALSDAIEELNPLCSELGVKRLWEFYSENPEEMAEFLQDDDGNAEGQAFPLEPEQWFSPAEGLLTVRALIDRLGENGAEIERSDGVLGDLRQMERILVDAERSGIGWHLAVDF